MQSQRVKVPPQKLSLECAGCLPHGGVEGGRGGAGVSRVDLLLPLGSGFQGASDSADCC